MTDESWNSLKTSPCPLHTVEGEATRKCEHGGSSPVGHQCSHRPSRALCGCARRRAMPRRGPLFSRLEKDRGERIPLTLTAAHRQSCSWTRVWTQNPCSVSITPGLRQRLAAKNTWVSGALKAWGMRAPKLTYSRKVLHLSPSLHCSDTVSRHGEDARQRPMWHSRATHRVG